MVKITLFGLAGTGTTTVGKCFAKKYNYEFKSSGNMFRQLAKDKKLDLSEFSTLCQNDSSIDMELDEKIENFGKKNNNFILDSRLGWYTIPDSIKIKLICADEIRFQRIENRDEISYIHAKLNTEKREISEKTRYFNYYKIEDYSKDINFNLIINTSNISPEEISKRIYDFIEKL